MVNSEKFAVLLKELGRPADASGTYDCPVHAGHPGTLTFRPGPLLPGGFHAVCTYPRCGFSGSILDLVAASRKQSIHEAAQAFLPGMPLYGMFFTSFGTNISDTDLVRFEVIRAESHKGAADYLVQARDAFMNSPILRRFLTDKGIKEDVFPQLQCCAPCPNAPDRLSKAMPAKDMEYKLVLPYMSGGLATDLAVCDVRDGARTTYHLEKQPMGIFLAHLVPYGAASVVVCPTELDAMVLLTKTASVGARKINPVALMDPSALDQLDRLQSATILSHADRPLFPASLMPYLRLGGSLGISVVELPGTLEAVAPIRVARIFEAGVEAWAWLASRIGRIAVEGGLAELTSSLAAMGLGKAEKSILLDRMEALGLKSTLVMEEVRNARPACLVRTCGSVDIRRSFSGYEQVLPCSRRLSNFILIVNYITGETRSKVFVATVKTDVPGCPGYDISIPMNELCTRDGTRVAHLVWERLLELGVKFNAYASSVADTDWATIVRMFDGADYKEQSRLVGIEGSAVRYPAMRVNLAGGSVTLAEPLANLPPIIMQSYSRVSGRRSPGPLLESLHARRDDVVDSFLGMMGHVLYETARAAKVAGYVPRHLLMPCSAPESLTENMLDKLGFMLGGVQEVPLLSPQVLKDQYMLGRLPLLCKSRNHMPHFSRMLNNSCNSMVLLHPAPGLRRCAGGIGNAYYLSELLTQDHCEIAPDIIENLASSWGHMLASTYAALESMEPGMPAISWMRKFCGGAPDKSLFVPVPYSGYGLKEFQNSLVHMLEQGLVSLAENEPAYSSRNTAMIGYHHGSHVRLFPSRISNAMARAGLEFSEKMVAEHMALMTIPAGRHKVIGREDWDRLTRRPSLTMISGDALKLVKTA